MKGILKKIEKKNLQTKDGKKKFTLIEFTCDVEVDGNKNIKTLRGSYGEDFARKYFEYCGVKTKDLIGKEVECILSKRAYENSEGEKRTIQYIKFLNVLDDNNKPILLPKEDNGEIDF